MTGLAIICQSVVYVVNPSPAKAVRPLWARQCKFNNKSDAAIKSAIYLSTNYQQFCNFFRSILSKMEKSSGDDFFENNMYYVLQTI